jgi:hypothetical protein
MPVSGDQELTISEVLRFIRRRWWIHHAPYLAVAVLALVRALIGPFNDSAGTETVAAVATALVFASFGYTWFVKPLDGLLCPRCGRPFFWRTKFLNAPWRCRSCALRLDGSNMHDEYTLADPMVPDYRKR